MRNASDPVHVITEIYADCYPENPIACIGSRHGYEEFLRAQELPQTQRIYRHITDAVQVMGLRFNGMRFVGDLRQLQDKEYRLAEEVRRRLIIWSLPASEGPRA